MDVQNEHRIHINAVLSKHLRQMQICRDIQIHTGDHIEKKIHRYE